MEEYDAVVIGGGIAGIQAALDLGDQGFRVLLVEKQASIGGTMIQLSKVFPTLDCASCITTPKMSAVMSHPNIEVKTLAEVNKVWQNDEYFEVVLLQKPRYVNVDACTGCGDCEEACPVIVHDFGYDEGLGAKKAVGVPFATALPQKAVLNDEQCIFCGKCARACPTDAIDFSQREEKLSVKAKSIIIATGFLQTPTIKKEYGGGKYKNVITGKQMDRILAPTSPFGGVFRPSDGKTPDSIAFLQCAGSRDASIGVPYCSAICCMYAIKQATLLSAAVPLADVTIYYMDNRTFGKNHAEFYQQAKAMGINFVKGKVAKITEKENGNLVLRVETFGEFGQIEEFEHDLVVLSLGLVPQWNPQRIIDVDIDATGFIKLVKPMTNPTFTSLPGVFVAGTAAGPKDIVESIVSGSAAAMKASEWLQGNLKEAFFSRELPIKSAIKR